MVRIKRWKEEIVRSIEKGDLWENYLKIDYNRERQWDRSININSFHKRLPTKLYECKPVVQYFGRPNSSPRWSETSDGAALEQKIHHSRESWSEISR